MDSHVVGMACHAGMFMGRKLLIFDFDGTIADTSGLHATAFRQALAAFPIVVDYERIAGLRTEDAMRMLLSWNEIEVSDAVVRMLVERKQDAVRSLINNELKPMPGADAFLRKAKQLLPLALVTSGSRGTVTTALSALGYLDWFQPLVCSDDVANAKPEPEGFLRALQVKGVGAGDALVFEDSDAGIAAARSAGIDVIDVRLTSWLELEACLT